MGKHVSSKHLSLQLDESSNDLLLPVYANDNRKYWRAHTRDAQEKKGQITPTSRLPPVRVCKSEENPLRYQLRGEAKSWYVCQVLSDQVQVTNEKPHTRRWFGRNGKREYNGEMRRKRDKARGGCDPTGVVLKRVYTDKKYCWDEERYNWCGKDERVVGNWFFTV